MTNLYYFNEFLTFAIEHVHQEVSDPMYSPVCVQLKVQRLIS